MKEKKACVTAVAAAYEPVQCENVKLKSEKDGLKQLDEEFMQKALSASEKRGQKKLYKIFSFPTFAMLSIAIEVGLYILCWQERSVGFALKRRLWPETGTSGLNSCSPMNKPSSLASTRTLFISLLSLFSLVESSTHHPSHLTQTCSAPPSSKTFQLNNGLQCFLSTLPGPTLTKPFQTALFLSKRINKQSQKSQVVKYVPLATFSSKPSVKRTLLHFGTPSNHKTSTTSGKSSA